MVGGRVLFCSGGAHLGGAEKSLLELAGRMFQEGKGGYSPHVVLPRAGGPLEEALHARGVPCSVVALERELLGLSREEWWKLTGKTAGVRRYYERLADVVGRIDPAIIHSNGIKLHLLTGLRALWSETPVLWHMRDILNDGVVRRALQLVSRLPRVNVVANSSATAAAFRPPTGRKVHVVHNALDSTEYYRSSHRELYDEYGLVEDRPIVALVGAIAAWKGQLEFIRSAASVLESGREANFVLVGDEIYDTIDRPSRYRQKLDAEVARLGIGQHVFFTGFVRDIAWLLNGVDVLVHASTEPEPFGRVIIEAMACGVPVAASKAGGVVEIVDEGETGLLHGPGKVEEMARNIRRLLDDPDLRRRMSERGMQVFRERFTMDRLYDRVVRLYDAITSQGTGVSAA